MFKRILSALLIAATLASVAIAPSAGEGDKKLAFDGASPLTLADGYVTVDAGTSANELLACVVDRAGTTLADKDGDVLSATDAVTTGAVLACGGESATVVVPGEVNGDFKINARDVLGAMRAIVDQTEGLTARAADADCDGALNAKDVVLLMKYLTGWDVALGAEREKAANEDPTLNMYFDSPLRRVAREDTTVYGEAEGLLRSAKNELEDILLVLTSEEAREGLTLDVGKLENAAGDAVEYELRYGYYYYGSMFNQLRGADYQNYVDANWADPFPKLRGDFSIGANESRSFLIKADVPADAASGWYSAPVVVRDGEGREIKRSVIRLFVWDFALDEETALNTLFCTSSYGIRMYAMQQYVTEEPVTFTDDEWQDIYDHEWFEFNLHNRLSDYHLPYDVTDPRADKYMNDPRVTAFVTAGGVQDKAYEWDDSVRINKLRATYDKLETNPVWAEKAYIYTVDEPGGDVARVKRQWDGAKAALGDTPFKTIVPGPNTMIENMWDYCNCLCPNIDLFLENAPNDVKKEDPYHYPPYGRYLVTMREYQEYGNFQPRYDKLRERGDSMWCYICVSPMFPYANFYMAYQGAWQRMVLWQTYMIHSDGLLYWDTVFWNVAEGDSRLINLKRTGSGDGLLLYPGIWWDEGMVPVPSVRYEYVRDGIEDFQYLKQLERVLGREESMKYVGRLCEGILTFSEDYKDMTAVRDELGFALESLAS